jgi:aryl-alcohol dehydrogenase-like predicted oxidoreductase
MEIPRRRLGTTDLQITTVGLGAWAIGGDWFRGWGPQDDAESIATIHHAVDVGVNWIDTAAAYGIGHSEAIIGQAIRDIPAADRPFVFTKCGVTTEGGERFAPTARTLRPAQIREEIEGSLARLGVERIDLYQFHWPDEGDTPIEDSWGAMQRLVDEGKVRHAGVCNFTVPLLDRAEALHHVDTLQPPFSMIRRDSGGELIPWALEHGTGVIVYSPMQSGILTDTFSAARVHAMAETDWRRAAPAFNEPALGRSIALRDALRAIAARHDTSVSAVAIAWTLAWPGVTGAIVGARRPDQVDGWIAGSQIDLSADDLAEIARAIGDTGAGSGPVEPVAARH